MTLSIQHNGSVVMLVVIVLSAVMLNVANNAVLLSFVMPNGIMLSVLAPLRQLFLGLK
jgi:hypothetical protein